MDILWQHRVQCTLNHSPGQQVSIFNATCKELSSNGLKWDIYPFSELWQGTLNEALSNEFTIQADGDYLIYRTHKI